MTKFQLLLRSRTTWMIVGMFFIGGMQNIMPFMPAGIADVIQTLLGAAAIYFKVNTKTDYR